MKTKILLLTALIISVFTFAQDNYFRGREAVQKGNFSIGLNTTGLSYDSQKGIQNINVDLNAGYFVADALQIKIGADADILIKGENSVKLNYSAGAKYYIENMFPVYVGYYGTDGYNLKRIKSYLDLRAGYAYFFNESINIEPSVGYLYSGNQADHFKFNLGINIFF